MELGRRDGNQGWCRATSTWPNVLFSPSVPELVAVVD